MFFVWAHPHSFVRTRVYSFHLRAILLTNRLKRALFANSLAWFSPIFFCSLVRLRKLREWMRINLKRKIFSLFFFSFRVKYNEHLMTRNNNNQPQYYQQHQYSKRTISPAQSTRTDLSSTDDPFVHLPDLTGLQHEEKQHILNVLLRDENLRNKHLSRFV